MATKKLADSTLYHLSPKGFWKKFRDATVLNPEISSGLPIQAYTDFPRRPRDLKRMQLLLRKNPYWKRDVRRAYPMLSVVTQPGLSSLLIEHSTPQAVAAPAEGEAADNTKAVAPQEPLDLAAAISKVSESTQVYSESKLPPTLTNAYPKWVPQRSPGAPQGEYDYFPMHLYK
ncbi:21 kDa subunit of NADH dehydrogenase [Rhodocollybia butyracea]|uniref:21 kDa subunit of NADH dehydrogenase n=1 Tax=Rhodocollybia butyracea TaxID=206335 RepID=A0A9P5PSW5_9AGAR|nr:21 kDa subunit of NADH dehydrogenase [Rhodocollybia butyracea]